MHARRRRECLRLLREFVRLLRVDLLHRQAGRDGDDQVDVLPHLAGADGDQAGGIRVGGGGAEPEVLRAAGQEGRMPQRPGQRLRPQRFEGEGVVSRRQSGQRVGAAQGGLPRAVQAGRPDLVLKAHPGDRRHRRIVGVDDAAGDHVDALKARRAVRQQYLAADGAGVDENRVRIERRDRRAVIRRELVALAGNGLRVHLRDQVVVRRDAVQDQFGIELAVAQAEEAADLLDHHAAVIIEGEIIRVETAVDGEAVEDHEAAGDRPARRVGGERPPQCDRRARVAQQRLHHGAIRIEEDRVHPRGQVVEEGHHIGAGDVLRERRGRRKADRRGVDVAPALESRLDESGGVGVGEAPQRALIDRV